MRHISIPQSATMPSTPNAAPSLSSFALSHAGLADPSRRARLIDKMRAAPFPIQTDAALAHLQNLVTDFCDEAKILSLSLHGIGPEDYHPDGIYFSPAEWAFKIDTDILFTKPGNDILALIAGRLRAAEIAAAFIAQLLPLRQAGHRLLTQDQKESTRAALTPLGWQSFNLDLMQSIAQKSPGAHAIANIPPLPAGMRNRSSGSGMAALMAHACGERPDDLQNLFRQELDAC